MALRFEHWKVEGVGAVLRLHDDGYLSDGGAIDCFSDALVAVEAAWLLTGQPGTAAGNWSDLAAMCLVGPAQGTLPRSSVRLVGASALDGGDLGWLDAAPGSSLAMAAADFDPAGDFNAAPGLPDEASGVPQPPATWPGDSGFLQPGEPLSGAETQSWLLLGIAGDAAGAPPKDGE